MNLYVKFEPPATVNEFLVKFFSVLSPYDTNIMNGQPTFFDKGCTKFQCHSNRMRSFDDLYYLVSTYYPEISSKDLMHEILVADICKENGQKLFPHLHSCSSMRRIRIIHFKNFCIIPINNVLQYNSKYSWIELLEMLGISSNAEVEEYANKNRKVVEPSN